MNNVRWGPGIESHANVHNDVGLWRGRQLVRLSWRPLAPSIVPEFMTNSSGRTIVEAHRILLRNTVENVRFFKYLIEKLYKYQIVHISKNKVQLNAYRINQIYHTNLFEI